MAGRGVGGPCGGARGQARHAGVAPGEGGGAVGRVLARRGSGRPPPRVPLRGERPGGGCSGQAAGPRRGGGPPGPPPDPGRHLRRPGPAGDTARHLRPGGCPGPGQAPRRAGPGLGPPGGRRDPPGPGAGPGARGRGRQLRGPCLRRSRGAPGQLPVRAEGRPDQRGPAHPGAGPRRGGGAGPGAGPHPAAPGPGALPAGRVEAECRRRLAALQEAGWPEDPGRWPAGLAGAGGDGDGVPITLAWVCQRLVPALRRTGDEVSAVLAALEGRHVPSGPSGAPSRGMAHVLPTGRNFYSLDPQAVPSPLAWSVGQELARELVERHLAETGRYPVSVGLVVWGTAAMRTGGDDLAEALALLGVRPVWGEESGRVVGVEPIPLAELGRPMVDVTLRVSGFFRDALPWVLGLFDDAVQLVAGLDEPESHNPLRTAGPGDPRVFGPKPGAYGSGILPLLESRDWRDDRDLAEVYLAWSGWGYRRPGPGQPVAGTAQPDAMRRRFSGIEVAVKNQDNREHDIFDSDDYLQDHDGMVATIRALSGKAPLAWFGDSADPSRPRVRSLSEEAARVVRTRVLNPKWIAAMQAHGYKGAFEMAATVDYLFGYDATAGVAEDWMYERVTSAYVADPEVRKFFERSNPWALRTIAERLLEARHRGLWDASEEALDALRSALLEAEGWEEERG